MLPFWKKVFPIVLILVLALGYHLWKKEKTTKLWQIKGRTMGHIAYHIQYLSTNKQLTKSKVDTLLTNFNRVFSIYLPEAEITHLNHSDTFTFRSPLWHRLLIESRQVYLQSNGAFDPTVAPLVTAWGFGPTTTTQDTTQLDTLLKYVGFNGISFSSTGIRKATPRLTLDMGAIAKGYAVDLIAELLNATEIKNYMIEIGGEVYVSGKRASEKPWRIGIQNPLQPNIHQAAAVLQLPHGGVATSGNYRNYKRIGKKLYVHTINPHSGRPIQHQLLSATIWASTCMRADALATACLVLGLAEAKALIHRTQEVEALFFYTDSTQLTRSYATPALRPYVSALRYHAMPTPAP